MSRCSFYFGNTLCQCPFLCRCIQYWTWTVLYIVFSWQKSDSMDTLEYWLKVKHDFTDTIRGSAQMPYTTSWRTHRSELSSLFWSILYAMTFAADLWIQILSDLDFFWPDQISIQNNCSRSRLETRQTFLCQNLLCFVSLSLKWMNST